MSSSKNNSLSELVRNMTRRSMPMPHPPVGGSPCSSLASVGIQFIQQKKHSRIYKGLIDPLSFIVSLFLLLYLNHVIFSTVAEPGPSPAKQNQPAPQIVLVARKDHSTRCRHCKIPCRTKILRNVHKDPDAIDAIWQGATLPLGGPL